MTPTDTGTPRRQERGRRRMEQILHAAADEFARLGYEAATTNGIAAAAGISPGSLYQFFSGKADIARALAGLYREQLDAAQSAAFTREDLAGLPVPDVVAAVIGPLVEFNIAHPGFKALFARTDMPAELAEAVAPIHAVIHGKVGGLLAVLLPELSTKDLERATSVAIQLVRGMMPLIVAADPAARPALVTDLRNVLVGYLDTLR
ncbi:TetR family transcriptional regulator [Stackebrandtia albiflava]|uniref:TetR family transcriptional regulator n=1 Tax=Stackebrandtia albiflava TaxID=406432 RepID=A0A562V2S9_9ACTN|nr:TetR/AcrR family transcriptional regulator [Stackebrandtia albiflava]TWJ12199.1 TetR family transcriptional regulator [Stackebrandtia albiflava]